MSVSQLPIQLPPPSNSHPIVSASVTRILTLANFSPDLKTRDLQGVFSKWSEDKGGYKIKWIDDVTALAVFADATVGEWSDAKPLIVQADVPCVTLSQPNELTLLSFLTRLRSFHHQQPFDPTTVPMLKRSFTPSTLELMATQMPTVEHHSLAPLTPACNKVG